MQTFYDKVLFLFPLFSQNEGYYGDNILYGSSSAVAAVAAVSNGGGGKHSSSSGGGLKRSTSAAASHYVAASRLSLNEAGLYHQQQLLQQQQQRHRQLGAAQRHLSRLSLVGNNNSSSNKAGNFSENEFEASKFGDRILLHQQQQQQQPYRTSWSHWDLPSFGLDPDAPVFVTGGGGPGGLGTSSNGAPAGVHRGRPRAVKRHHYHNQGR